MGGARGRVVLAAAVAAALLVAPLCDAAKPAATTRAGAVRSDASAAATPRPAAHGPSHVRIVRDGAAYHLEVDGRRFFVKGAGFDHGDPAELAARGANAFRTWRTDPGPAGAQLLQRARELGLYVAMGLEMRPERGGFDYGDAAAVARQQRAIRAQVLRFRNDPAVLAWVLGNELNLEAKDPRVWDAVEAATRMIHALDPNHPVLTTLAGFDPAVVAQVKRRAPSLDLVGIQLYAGLADLPKMLNAADWTGPYLVTEFGPTGHWETTKTPWGAPLEEDSTQKAAGLGVRYARSVVADPAHCLGAFVFLWGHKQERTPTWYGLFLPSGEATPSVDVMELAWRGRWPANRSPSIGVLQLDGKPASAGVTLTPGQAVVARVSVGEPDGDPVGMRWAVLAESEARSIGGDHEDVPPEVPLDFEGYVVGATARDPMPVHAVRFAAPTAPGHYRLFVQAHDGHGHAAYSNLPFRVAR
jgi:hypothetical protein